IVCFSYSTDAAPTARDTLSLHDALPIYTGVKLTREQIMVAEAMIQRGVSIRHMAKQFGVREGALRYRLRQLAEGERPDGRSRQRTATDGYEEAIHGVLERLEDVRLTGEGRPAQARQVYEILTREYGFTGSYKSVVRHIRRR